MQKQNRIVGFFCGSVLTMTYMENKDEDPFFFFLHPVGAELRKAPLFFLRGLHGAVVFPYMVLQVIKLYVIRKCSKVLRQQPGGRTFFFFLSLHSFNTWFKFDIRHFEY